MRALWAGLKLAAGALIALALCHTQALAQGAVQQNGPITPFRSAAWYANGSIGDGGAPTSARTGALGIFNGSQCPFGVSSQPGAGAITTPYALFTLCQTLSTTTFSFQGKNGAGPPNVLFDIGGTIYPFPGGVIPDQPFVTAAEAITAPALVNVSTTFKMVHANATTGLPANAFILTSVANGGSVQVYFTGLLAGLGGLTPGRVFLSTVTPGGVTQTPPANGSAAYVQPVGFALSNGSIEFTPATMNGPL